MGIRKLRLLERPTFELQPVNTFARGEFPRRQVPGFIRRQTKPVRRSSERPGLQPRFFLIYCSAVTAVACAGCVDGKAFPSATFKDSVMSWSLSSSIAIDAKSSGVPSN